MFGVHYVHFFLEYINLLNIILGPVCNYLLMNSPNNLRQSLPGPNNGALFEGSLKKGSFLRISKAVEPP